MCGICGQFAFAPDAPPVTRDSIEAMMGSMEYRGPDEADLYLSGQVGLGHRRLKIIDLTTGQQPLSNQDGTVWIIFNGEVYNYVELRKQLVSNGHRFKSKSDTEVIVHMYEEYGEKCVPMLDGMFSFAIWDGRNNTLLIARDRVGIKPLYYCESDGVLAFASEIKALFAAGVITPEVEPAMVDRFLTYYYTPGAMTTFKGVRKLLPGHYMVVRDGRIKTECYWDLQFPSVTSTKEPKALVQELTDLLRDSVRSHMISDVPVGVLLSGGVDSTAMLSFAVEQAQQEVSSFTIGFDGASCVDERPFARLAAERFGSRHYETTITAKDFADFLPRYIWHMEEPVCEPPAVALYYVSKMAREHVTVLLSGEGGDEVFAGYQTYRNLVWLEAIKRGLGPLSGLAAKGMSALASLAGLPRVQHYAELAGLPIADYYHSRTSDPTQFFNRAKHSFYSDDFRSLIAGQTAWATSRDLWSKTKDWSILNRMLYVDTKTWLPDDLLVKADKITMANSLELRVPLLDHHVLEFGASIPQSLKLKGITTKYLLKKAMEPRVPAEILNRPKTGFPVPYNQWLRHDLRDIVRGILLDPSTKRRGYFASDAVETLLDNNDKDGRFSKEVFSLLALELWHRTFLDQRATLTPPAVVTSATHV